MLQDPREFYLTQVGESTMTLQRKRCLGWIFKVVWEFPRGQNKEFSRPRIERVSQATHGRAFLHPLLKACVLKFLPTLRWHHLSLNMANISLFRTILFFSHYRALSFSEHYCMSLKKTSPFLIMCVIRLVFSSFYCSFSNCSISENPFVLRFEYQ